MSDDHLPRPAAPAPAPLTVTLPWLPSGGKTEAYAVLADGTLAMLTGGTGTSYRHQIWTFDGATVQ